MTRAARPTASLAQAPRPTERAGLAALPKPARLVIAMVGAGGLACVLVGLAQVKTETLPPALLFLTLAVLASAVKIDLPLPGGGSTLSISYIVSFAAMLVLGPWPTAPIAAASAWAQCNIRTKRTNTWYQSLFSVGTLAISVALAGVLHHAISTRWPNDALALGAAVVLAATAYFLLNTGLISLVMSASSGGGLRQRWTREFSWSAPSYYIGAGLATLAIEITKGDRVWWLTVLAVPAYLIFRSYAFYIERLAEEQRQVQQASDVQMAIVEALATAIEAKDNTSTLQADRMRIYAEGLAQAVSMAESEILGVKTAALLHDIGNLAVPEHILSKPGPLTYEEFERVKIHPRVGADILANVPFPYPVIPLVLCHHERWDGRGYPGALRGEVIPLGARVLAVADCYTAMLSARPYRPARTVAEAIATLRENAGSALDPDLVEKFIELLPALEARIAEASAAGIDRLSDSQGAETALANIAIAHREEQLIRDLGQSLSSSLRVSDALSMISTSLVSMMPLDACALFIADPESGLLMCSHVLGSHQDAIRMTTAASIEGLKAALPTGTAPLRGAQVRLQSVLVAPLTADSGTVGALAVYHAQRRHHTADHLRLLTRVAEHAANVIANALVFEQAQEQLLTDVLTGLPNRRHLERHLAEQVARVQRHGGQFSVLVLDMDGFKQINDEFGHQAGDSALKEVAQVLRGSLRPYDVCARFAGDEFVLVIAECDGAQAERRRLDLQQAIASLWVEPLPGRIVPLSVSVGAATFPDDAATVEEAVRLADQRMYQDKADRKRTGPQRSVASGPLWME
jgi:diguanylate cyclase (GGDEF)-like protein